MQAFITFSVHSILTFFQLTNMLSPSSYRIIAAHTIHLEYSFPHRLYPFFFRKIGKTLFAQARVGALTRDQLILLFRVYLE